MVGGTAKGVGVQGRDKRAGLRCHEEEVEVGG